MEDQVDITNAARRALMPWFDSERLLEQWAIDQLLVGADQMRLLLDPPDGWDGEIQTRRKQADSWRYVETVGGAPEAVLLFDARPEAVTLRAAWTRCVRVGLTRHAQERLHERVDQLEPNYDRRRQWLNATVDRALRNEQLSLNAPRWAASAPLKPGLGWTTRKLRGDEIALLVSAPRQHGGAWNIVTVLTKSTAITPLGRVARLWKRGSRLVANRLKYRTASPVRAQATRPPVLGDTASPPRRRRPPPRN